MRLIYILLAILLFSGCSGSKKAESSTANKKSDSYPSWITARPLQGNYYIGISKVSKTLFPANYVEEAKKQAFDDLASEIEVKVESNSILYTFETQAGFKDDFIQSIKLSSSVDLELYELVDQYESAQEFAMYYRIDKRKFVELKQEREAQAINASKEWLKKAKDAELNRDWKVATLNYALALDEIKSHWRSTLKTNIDGQEVFYGNYVYRNLQRSFDALQVTTQPKRVRAAYGLVYSKEKLVLKTAVDGRPIGDMQFNLSGESIRFTNASLRTDARGGSTLPAWNTTSAGQFQINIQFDLNSLPGLSEELKNILEQSIRLPSTQVLVSSETPRISVNVLGLRLPANAMSGIQESLRTQALLYDPNVSTSDMQIELNLKPRKGGEFNGLFTMYIDMEVRAVTNNGAEVYYKDFGSLKGVDLNYDRAKVKALEAFGATFSSEIAPSIRKKLRK